MGRGYSENIWDYLLVWYRASRPFTFTASIVPVLVGSALAFVENQFDPVIFVIVLFASLMVQVVILFQAQTVLETMQVTLLAQTPWDLL